MKIKYYNENEKLISSTEDYVPNVGDFINIDHIVYEVLAIKIAVVALHTEFDVYLSEREHDMSI